MHFTLFYHKNIHSSTEVKCSNQSLMIKDVNEFFILPCFFLLNVSAVSGTLVSKESSSGY